MSDENMKIWDALKRPPESALKTIQGGRLNGMTDISPQWRYQAMTELFGPVGFGWKSVTEKLWTEPGSDGQVCAFAQVSVYVKQDGEWSEAIHGVGGSMLIANEKNGPYTSDEAYKMAETDALSVAMKKLGVAADIYMGLYDGSKYREQAPQPNAAPKMADKTQLTNIKQLIVDVGADEKKLMEYLNKKIGVSDLAKLPAASVDYVIATIEKKRKQSPKTNPLNDKDIPE